MMKRDISDTTAAFFGDNAKMVRHYIANTDAMTAAERAEKAAATNDRKARWTLINEAAYWTARWERFGAIC